MLPTYPTKVCLTCKELVEATFALKIMYEKTSEVLKNLLIPIEDHLVDSKAEFTETKYSIQAFHSDEEFDTTIKYEVDDQILPENNYEIEDYHSTSTTDENAHFEEEIILKIEEADSELSKNERKKIYNKKKRILEKQEVLELAEKIDNEIETTLNQSDIKLKKFSNFTHTCPICFVEKTDPLMFRKHIRTHQVLQKNYLKGELLKSNTLYRKTVNATYIFWSIKDKI